MQKVKVRQCIFVTMGFISTVLSQPPAYSAHYAKVRYQPQQELPDSKRAELNLDQSHKEEVTEKVYRPPPTIQEKDSEPLSSAEIVEVTTERESEQINFARFTHSKALKDKLEEQTEYFGQEMTTILNADYNKAEAKSEDVDINRENAESLNDSDESELEDLNDQGVYYIIHPNGLFQKVVYKTMDERKNMQITTQIPYKNVEPIVEPIYSYDPRTFVLQRLILRSPQYY